MNLKALGLLVCLDALFGCSGPEPQSKVSQSPSPSYTPCTREPDCASSEVCIAGRCEQLWSGEGAPAPGVRSVLAEDDHLPWLILADRGNVYWANNNGYESEINELSFTGQRETSLGGWPLILDFTVDEANVYFSTRAGVGYDQGLILFMPLTGGTKQATLLDGLKSPWSLHAKDGFVYYADNSVVARVAIGGGQPEMVLPTMLDAASFAVLGLDDANLYVSTSTSIWRIAFSGTSAELPLDFKAATQLTSQTGHSGVLSSSGDVYWATTAGIERVGAGGTSLLVPVAERVSSIAVDGEFVYWDCPVQYCSSIRKVEIASGVVSEVVHGNSSCGLAVDAQSVFWCDRGYVFRADK